MKILAFVLSNLVCFLSCSNSASSNVGNNGSVESLRVDSYENNELFQSFFFQDGLYVKRITYNTQTRKKDHEITFFYKKNGELDHAKIDGAVALKEDRIEIRRSFEEFDFQYAKVKSKGVIFPLPTIAADEVRDLSEVFSIADNYRDFKTESEIKGDQKTIKFISFNKTIRFQYSPMSLLMLKGDFITIRDYLLTLQNGFPALEVYRTSDGELTKIYSYKDEQLIGVVYKFISLQNQSSSLEKRFDYHKLNGKP